MEAARCPTVARHMCERRICLDEPTHTPWRCCRIASMLMPLLPPGMLSGCIAAERRRSRGLARLEVP